jgi:hypothetical protein
LRSRQVDLVRNARVLVVAAVIAAAGGTAAVAPLLAAVLAEIRLGNVCSCQEILRRHGRNGQDEPRLLLAAAACLGCTVPCWVAAAWTTLQVTWPPSLPLSVYPPRPASSPDCWLWVSRSPHILMSP